MLGNAARMLIVNRRRLLRAGALLVAASWLGPFPAIAQEKEPVVLGFVTGLSGSQAQYGRDNLKVAELFAEQINAKGGIDGREVQTISGDTQEQPDIAISLARRLLRENKVTAFLGHGSSGLTLALSQR